MDQVQPALVASRIHSASTAQQPSPRSMTLTPLGIIAGFVALSETAGALAATMTTGVVQVLFTLFAIVFPIAVAGAFFAILWKRPYVLYPPQEFGPSVDVRHYVDAMRQQALGSQEVLTLVRTSIEATLKSHEGQLLLSGALGEANVSAAKLKQVSSELAKHAVDQLEGSMITVDISEIAVGPTPDLVFRFDPKENAFAFLSAIWFQISDFVPAYTYGKVWALEEQTTKQRFVPTGIDLADTFAMATSTATVADIGLAAGMRVRVIRLQKSSAVFGAWPPHGPSD